MLETIQAIEPNWSFAALMQSEAAKSLREDGNPNGDSDQKFAGAHYSPLGFFA
jgi:hypothetical protein